MDAMKYNDLRDFLTLLEQRVAKTCHARWIRTANH